MMGRARMVAAAVAVGLLVATVPATGASGAAEPPASEQGVGETGLPAPFTLHPGAEAPESGPIPVHAQQAPDLSARQGRAGAPEDIGLVPPGSARASAQRVVDIRHDGDQASVEALVVSLGGRVNGPAGGHSLEAVVDRTDIEALRAGDHVTEVTTPSISTPEASTATTGQEVAKLNANDWQAAGITGAGVKVGIIDSFDDAYWNPARSSGDLPAASGTFCRQAGASCDIWAGGKHGVAVGEIVYEMAPGTQLYIASVLTAADFQAAINYFQSQGVKVVTRSQTAEYDGPGNGTGPNADVVASAVSKGMVYLNSAGNSGGNVNDFSVGSYWRGTWYDPDGDGWLDWVHGDEVMDTKCWFFNGLRWGDWGANRTNYDVYMVDPDTLDEIGSSKLNQSTGASPIERLNTFPCNAQSDVGIAVRLVSPGSGTSGDVIEMMNNGVGLEYWQNAYSASAPMADSASPGMLTVGAIDPPNGTTIASYSSWGPTNDGRTKPDLSAAACVNSRSYAPDCFNGTSSATPVAAGAVALAWSSGQFTTPAQVVTYIKGSVFDRGVAGNDNVYGRGEVILDTPGSSSPYSSWTAFVNRQYADLVGRAPTAAERQRWAFNLSLGGQSPAALVQSLRTSSEHATNVDPVARLYWAYFLRIPDKAGLDYWIGRRRAGTSLGSISQGFANSPEFKAKYGTLGNQAFVNLVYQNVLGRPGEADGVAYWTGQLTSGARTRGAVMSGFSESPEYKTKMRGSVDVAVITSALLKRAPTTAEVNARKAQTTIQIAQWALTLPAYVKP